MKMLVIMNAYFKRSASAQDECSRSEGRKGVSPAAAAAAVSLGNHSPQVT